MHFVQNPGHDTNVMDVMKMGNIALRIKFEPTPPTILGTTRQTIIPPSLPDAISLSTCLGGSLPERSVQTTLFVYSTHFFSQAIRSISATSGENGACALTAETQKRNMKMCFQL